MLMMLFIIFLSVFTEQFRLGWQASLTDTFYTAGVVEFQSADSSLPPSIQLEDNLKGFLEIIASEEARETDIIVFPEMTLNSNTESTFVPDPEVSIIAPCDNDPNSKTYHMLLVNLSCQAKNYTKYVVINIVEKEKCLAQTQDPRPCAEYGYNLYNTNVVFDRSGQIVSRYRKVHLYGEERNTTYIPEVGIFDTDFNVRFGHFTCFDILFYAPAQKLVDKLHIRDFVYPTMWFSQLPFLTGVQFQHSWAYGNNVNLLAAGFSRPEFGSSGSGIYNGRRGTVISITNLHKGERRIYVAKLPKNKKQLMSSRSISKRQLLNPKSVDQVQSKLSFNFKRDYLENYNTIVLNLTEGNSLTQKICHRRFCCNFNLKWKTNTKDPSEFYTYRLGVYYGPRNKAAVEINIIRNCALFTCTSLNIDDCGKVFSFLENVKQSEIAFTQLSIEANYPHSKEFLVMPNSLTNNFVPLEPTDFKWDLKRNGDSYHLHYAIKQTVDNLLTFASYGNYYDDEGTIYSENNETDPEKSTGKNLNYNFIVIVTMFQLQLFVKLTSLFI